MAKLSLSSWIQIEFNPHNIWKKMVNENWGQIGAQYKAWVNLDSQITDLGRNTIFLLILNFVGVSKAFKWYKESSIQWVLIPQTILWLIESPSRLELPKRKSIWECVGLFIHILCRNPSLGFMTKARACKGAGQVRRSGITFHTPESVGECEGMNSHIPKWVPILGIGVLMDFQMFREQFHRSKPIGL